MLVIPLTLLNVLLLRRIVMCFHYNVYKFVPLIEANDVNVFSNDASVQQIVKSLKRTYVRNENIIPDTERNKLLNVLTVPNTSVDEFVNLLLQQQTIMTSLKPAILSESSVGASSRCVRSKESYLYGSKYTDLKDKFCRGSNRNVNISTFADDSFVECFSFSKQNHQQLR